MKLLKKSNLKIRKIISSIKAILKCKLGGRVLSKRPRSIYILVLLWLALATLFTFWAGYAVSIIIQLPDWVEDLTKPIVSVLNFGYLMAAIAWFVFSAIFTIFAYGTFKKETWVWTTGIIISTIFLAIFALMIASFMVNSLLYLNVFSVLGLVTVVLALIIDLGIIFYLTRPVTKIYFDQLPE